MQPAKGNYDNENETLRELHLARQERLKRQRAESDQKDSMIEVFSGSKLSKKLLTHKEQEHSQMGSHNKIYLNTMIYDPRSSKPDFCIGIATLFKDFPTNSLGAVSKNIEVIFMSTFGFEMQLLYPLAQTGIRLTVLNHSDNKGPGKVFHDFSGFKNMTVVNKEKDTNSYGVFHTKLWLIKFKTFLRVVVSTGNLHLGDWSHWQNAYWYQDFPLKSCSKDPVEKQEASRDKKSFDFNQDFQETLNLVLNAMLPQNVYSLKDMGINLNDYLFSNISIVLIPSLPGSHKNDKIKQQGLGKIEYIIKNFGEVDFGQESQILTYNSTSLGTIDADFCESIYRSFVPKFGVQMKPENYRLVYPTLQYINNETCGSAETLFLTKANYEKSNLGKRVLYRYSENPQNFIKGCIPHLKTVIVDTKESNDCIFYIGSHNMTKAAWGKYTNKNGSLSISNSELGILFLKYSKKQLNSWLPFKYPPEKYSESDRPFVRDMF